jgi:DNA polymerase III subunit beta
VTDILAALLADDDDPADLDVETQQVLAFDIKKFVLQTLLEKAITVVPTRDVMPVLKCFQFNVDPQRLRIIASDVVMSLIATTSMVSVSQPGTAVFPAKKLLDIVKSAADGDVNITVKGTTARIVIGRTSWTLQLQGGDDYPLMPAITEAAFTQIDRKAFAEALTAVRYAASRDPSRANLNIIHITDGKLTACDGIRIQQIQIKDFNVDLRIPINAVDDLLRLLKISDLDTIYVGQSDDKLIFRFGSDVFITSKFFAQFPDMENQMLRPALSNRHTLDVDRAELIAAIRRIRINADINSSAIALHLERNELTITAKDKCDNTASETIFANFSGTPRTIVVNHVYLTDMIKTHGDTTCSFRLGDDTKTRRTPLLLRHPTNGSIGVVQQMLADWLGQ